MENISISVSDLLFICGALAAIWGAWKIVKEIKKPSSDLRKQVQEHEKKLEMDYQHLEEVDQYNRVICKSLLALIDHEITGNNINNLKSTKKELQDFLVDK